MFSHWQGRLDRRVMIPGGTRADMRVERGITNGPGPGLLEEAVLQIRGVADMVRGIDQAETEITMVRLRCNTFESAAANVTHFVLELPLF